MSALVGVIIEWGPELSTSEGRSVISKPSHPISVRLISIFSYLRQGFPSGLFPSSFYQNPVRSFPLPKPRTCVCQRSPQKMALSVQGVVLLVVTPCSLVGRHRHVLHIVNVDCYNGFLHMEALNIPLICVVHVGYRSVPSKNLCSRYEMAALLQCLTRNLVECEWTSSRRRNGMARAVTNCRSVLFIQELVR